MDKLQEFIDILEHKLYEWAGIEQCEGRNSEKAEYIHDVIGAIEDIYDEFTSKQENVVLPTLDGMNSIHRPEPIQAPITDGGTIGGWKVGSSGMVTSKREKKRYKIKRKN